MEKPGRDEIIDRLRPWLADRYEIESEVGSGGMAIVFRTYDRRHERRVALKVLRPELSVSIGAERFLTEIKVTAGLQHPHILPLYDSGEANGLLCYVMPFVEGESLRDLLEREPQLALDHAVSIVSEVADGLSYAHSRGIVHRDIKPDNILLSGGHAVISDFGIARAIGVAGGDKLTSTGISIGTPAYMSPEQAAGEPRTDGRSDIYSTACVLYETLAGEPPFSGPNVQAVLARQMNEPPPSVRAVRPSIPQPVDDVILKALSKIPADRFATAREFADHLLHATTSDPTGFPTSAETAPPRERRQVGAPVRWLATISLAALIIVAAWMLLPRGGTTMPGATADGRAIAVFPFRATSRGGDEWIETLADLLATNLEGTVGVRVPDTWPLWQSLRSNPGARARPPALEEASELARASGADRFITGTVADVNGRLMVTVRVYDETRDVVLARQYDTAPTAIGDLAQEMAVDVITAALAERPGDPQAARLVGSITTESAEALKSYLVAREAMRRGQVQEADAAIDRSLALDSSFALALIEATIIKSWVQYMTGRRLAELLPLAQRAATAETAVSTRHRLRAEAVLASILTQGERAASASLRILEEDSTDLASWALLSYVRRAYGWQFGAPPSTALEAAERVSQLDPAYVPGVVTRAELVAALSGPAALRQEVDRLVAADTTNDLVRGALAGMRAIVSVDPDHDAATAAALPPGSWAIAYRMLRAVAPDRALTFGAALNRRIQAPARRQALRGARLRLLAAQGRFAELADTLAAGGLNGATERMMHRIILASAFAGMVEPALARRSMDALVRTLPSSPTAADLVRGDALQNAWAIAAYEATWGDSASAAEWVERFGGLPEGGVQRDYRASLQADIQARAARRRGNLPGAVTLARRALDDWSIHSDNATEDQPEPAMRMHLGLLLVETGDTTGAVTWFQSMIPPTAWLGAYTPRAAAVLADLLPASAERLFQLVWAHWDAGDATVGPWRDRARDRLDSRR